MLETLRLLRSAPRRDRTTIEAYQSARLRRLVARAYERVPYYRRLFDAHQLQPRHIRGIADLHLIPITSRRDLQAAPPQDLVTRGTDPARLITSSTSGSTGEPLRIRRTWLEQNIQHLYRMRALKSVGVRSRDRLLRIVYVRPVDPRDSKVIGRVLSALGLQRTRRDVHILMDPQAIAAEVNAYRPDVLSGSPSILARLIDVLSAEERRALAPRLVLSSGEVLTPVQRAQFEEAFGAPVRNVYASYEMGVVAWECTITGAMHTSDDSAIVEVMVDGRPAEPGETGQVVATNLHSWVAPFLRYRHGDLATRGLVPCACGQPFGTLTEIQGRELDLLPLPDGRMLHPYKLLGSLVASADHWFRQYQVTQERIDRIVVRVVPAGEPAPELLDSVRQDLAKAVGQGVEVELRLVPTIELEPGGKFRAARSLVKVR